MKRLVLILTVLFISNTTFSQKIDVNNIESITINTFHEAKRLDNRYPENTEQAQYSLPYPVAVALVFERLSAQEVSAKFFKNKKVVKLTEKILVCESDKYNLSLIHI